MKFRRSAIIIFILCTLAGCSSTKEQPTISNDKFPGFTQVSTKAAGAKFYVDESSVKAVFEQPTTFKMLQILSDGYAIQDAVLADNRLVSVDGLRYKSDGSVSGKFPGITVDLDSDNQTGLLDVVSFVNKVVSKKRAIAGTFEDSKALQILYGDYRPDLNGSMRTDVTMPSGNVAPTAVSKVILSVPFEKGNQKQHLLLVETGSEDNACHACVPLVSAAIFQEKDNSWQLLSSFASVPVPGHDGKSAKCEWQKIGNENFGLITKFSDVAQGICFSQLNLITLDGDTATQILSAESENDHELADSAVNFEKSKEKFWKAKVTFNYPDKADNKVFNYVYDNGHYDEKIPPQPDTVNDSPKPTPVESDQSTNDEGEVGEPPVEKPKAHTAPPHNERSNRSKPAKAPARNRTKEIVPNGELDPKLFLDH